jgi:hypothetical protein
MPRRGAKKPAAAATKPKKLTKEQRLKRIKELTTKLEIIQKEVSKWAAQPADVDVASVVDQFR